MRAKLKCEAEMTLQEKEDLRNKLNKYYGTVNDYTAFESVSNQVQCWTHIGNEIRRRIETNQEKSVKVLEIGAGRSGFGEWMKTQGLRNNICWTAQDVTSQNANWLEHQADHVFLGDVSKLLFTECFDIIFSTYVLEHVTNPAFHLEHLYKLLQSNGSLFIFCPRYDVPGYLCPSSRHLNWLNLLNFQVKWIYARCISMIKRQPAFLIQTDLAAFHKPFFLDADAVHWVSLIDLKLWAQSKGASAKLLKIGQPKWRSKDWIVKRLLTCGLEIIK